MAGKWIKRKADEHICERPREVGFTEKVDKGDLWECECSKVWRVYSVWYGDQREPLEPGQRPTISWEPGV